MTASVVYDGYGRLTNYTRTGVPTQDNRYNGLDDRVQVTATTGGVADVRRYVYGASGRLMGDYGPARARGTSRASSYGSAQRPPTTTAGAARTESAAMPSSQ